MTQAAFGRVALRTLLVLVSLAVAVLFFGLCMPMFLLSIEVLPSKGLGSIIYLIGGAAFGLLAGGVWAWVSLPRGGPLVTRRYLIGVGVALGLMAIYWVAYLNIEALQRHH